LQHLKRGLAKRGGEERIEKNLAVSGKGSWKPGVEMRGKKPPGQTHLQKLPEKDEKRSVKARRREEFDRKVVRRVLGLAGNAQRMGEKVALDV